MFIEVVDNQDHDSFFNRLVVALRLYLLSPNLVCENSPATGGYLDGGFKNAFILM